MYQYSKLYYFSKVLSTPVSLSQYGDTYISILSHLYSQVKV